MNEFKKLIMQSFMLSRRERWLKLINKEFDTYRKYNEKATHYKNKANHHFEMARRMNGEYNKIFNKESEGK